MRGTDISHPPARCLADVLESFKPLFLFERIFGVVKVNFKNGEVRPPLARDKILGVAAAAFYLLLSYFAFFTVSFDVRGEGAASNELVPKLCIVTQYATVAAASLFAHGNDNVNIYRNLASVDFAFGVHLRKDVYRDFRRCSVLWLAALVVAHLVFDLTLESEVDDHTELVRKSGLLFLHFFKDVQTIAFCRHMAFVRARLDIINQRLSALIEDPVERVTERTVATTPGFGRPLVDSDTQLTDLCRVYGTLGETCALVNAVYDLHALWSLVATFTQILVAIWTALSRRRLSPHGRRTLLVATVWPVTCYCTVLLLCAACERLAASRAETRRLLSEAAPQRGGRSEAAPQRGGRSEAAPQRGGRSEAAPQRGGRSEAADAFAQMTDVWPLRLTVCGMFDVDYSLALSFAAASTTYLIVLLQLSHFI